MILLSRNRRSTIGRRFVTETYLSHVSQKLRRLQVLWLVCLETVAVQIVQNNRKYLTE